MRLSAASAAWMMVGAVIGAGFASGRELAAFFSRWGRWSYLAIGAAVFTMSWLTKMALEARLSQQQTGRMALLTRWMLLALLTVTGGAMLAGAGDIAAMILPYHGARVGGMAVCWVCCFWMTGRNTPWLSRLSGLMTIALILFFFAGLFMQPMKGVSVQVSDERVIGSILHGLCYGGMNSALAYPLLNDAGEVLNARQRRHTRLLGCLLLLLLLLGGNAVLLRHGALMGEGMPLLALAAQWGKPGFFLGAGMLSLAIVTTLLSCMRGAWVITRSKWPLIMMAIVSLMGFSGAVEKLYPILGGCCLLLVVAANFRNCCAGAFHSGKPMI